MYLVKSWKSDEIFNMLLSTPEMAFTGMGPHFLQKFGEITLPETKVVFSQILNNLLPLLAI